MEGVRLMTLHHVNFISSPNYNAHCTGLEIATDTVANGTKSYNLAKKNLALTYNSYKNC